MAEFMALEQFKEDVQKTIEKISGCIEKFGQQENKKNQFDKIDADVKELEADRIELEADLKKERYKSSLVQIRISGTISDIGGELLDLLPKRGQLNNEIEALTKEIAQYLKYINFIKYSDKTSNEEMLNMLKYLLSLLADSKCTVKEFCAILLLIRMRFVFTPEQYKATAKSYSYATRDSFIVEELMNYSIDDLCKYIACQKI